MSVTGALPEINELSATADPKIRALLAELKAWSIEQEGVQHPLKWYPPKVIVTEETKSSTTFATMTTPDEITGIVIPENGILFVNYLAAFKSSVSSAGAASIFIGANQAEEPNGSLVSVSTEGASQSAVQTMPGGLKHFSLPAFNTKSMVGAGTTEFIGLAPGTYAVSVKYKASSGSVTVKERRLACWVLGT